MSPEGELRHVHLFLKADRLLLAVSALSGEMEFSGRLRQGAGPAGKRSFKKCMNILWKPFRSRKYIIKWSGGLLAVRLSGTETWLCRFSGSKMREMRRFTDRLEQLLHPERECRRPPEREEEECCPKCGLPYPERGRAVCPRCMEKSTVMLRILAYFKEYRWRVVVMLLCVAASGVLNAIWPYLSGTVLYDKVLGKNGDFASSLGFGGNFMLMLGFLVFIMTVTKLLQQITGVIHGRMTAYMVPGVVCKIKNSVFAALQKLSVGFFTRRQTGSLMQRVNADANEVMQFFIDGLPYLLFNVLTILVTAVVMFVMDWRLALVALFLLPPLFLVSYWLLPRLWHAFGRRARVVRSPLFGAQRQHYRCAGGQSLRPGKHRGYPL